MKPKVLTLWKTLNKFYTSLIDECDHIFVYWDSKNSREFNNAAISPYMLLIISLLQQNYSLNYVQKVTRKVWNQIITP